MHQPATIEWVPIAEIATAKRNRWYLTTNEFGGVEMHWLCARGHFVNDNFEPVRDARITAWATLPEPYREVQHEAD